MLLYKWLNKFVVRLIAIGQKINGLFCGCLVDIMEEELFAQFNKIANTILYSKSKEQQKAGQNTGESNTQDGGVEKESPKKDETKERYALPCGVTGQNDNLVKTIKALQVDGPLRLISIISTPPPLPS